MFNIIKRLNRKREPREPENNSIAKPSIKEPGLQSYIKTYQNSAKPLDFNLRILAIADTHNKLSIRDGIYLPALDSFDLCILLGDISKGDIGKILEKIPATKIIGVLGNHDDFDTLSQFNIPNINNTIHLFNSVKIAGLEGCIKYKETQPGYSLEESFKIMDTLPYADILISHNIPYGFMGQLNSVHIGNPAINNYLYRTGCPLNICGHNHSHKEEALDNNSYVIETHMAELISIIPGKVITKQIEM